MTAKLDRKELLRLFGALTDGIITPEEHRRLQELLTSHAEARRLWFLHSDLERGLVRWAETRRATSPEARVFRPPVWVWTRNAVLAGLAASIIVSATLLLDRALLSPPAAGPVVPAQSIATLLLADECEWRNGSFVEGQPLFAGQTLRLTRGMAVVRFDSGAEIALGAETELALASRGSVRLLGGRITVRALEEASGFVVHTPASDVTDLGTEFAVSVERQGATEVLVLEGQVTLGKPGAAPGTAQLLNAGKAVRIEPACPPVPAGAPSAAPRFAEMIEAATVKPRTGWLLAAEPFDHPPGPLPLGQASGGQGWAEPWQERRADCTKPADDSTLDIAMGSLNRHWPVAGGHGPALRGGGGYFSRMRRMSIPIRLDRDGIYYVSLMVRQEIPPDGKDEPSRVWLGLRSARDQWGDRVLFRLGALGRRQIEVRKGEFFVSPAAMERQGAQFWVGKIVAREHGEDEVFFRVYEDGERFDLVEPASWTVRTRGLQSDAQLDLVELTVSGPGVCWFDELRLGTNWRAAVFAPGTHAELTSPP